jgi:hypothetical protein
MLKSYMNKLLFIILLGYFSSIDAKEPTLAILQNISSTSVQKFTIANYSFYCDAYAVIAVDKLAKSPSVNSTCKKSLNGFYKRKPQSQYYAQEILKVLQMYHLDFKEGKCLVFAQGEVTLSELLLKEGLAVLEPNFQDDEYKALFRNAQSSAKMNKRGLWSESIIRDCIAEIYKK